MGKEGKESKEVHKALQGRNISAQVGRPGLVGLLYYPACKVGTMSGLQ